MTDHPLLERMTTAGTLAQRVATNVRAANYGAFDLSGNMAILGDALVADGTGFATIDDRCTLDDRDRSKADRDAARARMAERMTISRTLADLPVALRRHIINALAEGRGAIEAEALRLAADAAGMAIRATVANAAARVTA